MFTLAFNHIMFGSIFNWISSKEQIQKTKRRYFVISAYCLTAGTIFLIKGISDMVVGIL